MEHLHSAIQKWTDPQNQNLSKQKHVEYRLLCSGELYNFGACCPPHYIDYWRNPFLRLILDGLPGLFVTNEPHSPYPQELSFTFDCYVIEDSSNGSSVIYHNDQEVAEEFTALFSVLTRRLVCVFCKISEYNYNKEATCGLPQYWPHQVYNASTPRVWSKKSATLIYDGQERPKIESHMPPPVGIDTSRLKKFLKKFASLNEAVAKNFISASRLYKTALTFIEDESAIAYLHLIFCIETIANFVYSDFIPDRATQIRTKNNVKKLAMRRGLEEPPAEDIAVEACKGIPWAKKKFVKFIVEHTNDSLFTKEDSLFNLPILFAPKKQNFEDSLDEIYKMRSNAGHRGQTFPPQVGLGTQPNVSIFAMTQFERDFKKTGTGFVVPPATWFERVVNLALLTYIEKLTGVDKIAVVDKQN